MSNRKYAAGLLEGGGHTDKERMDSLMVFVRQFVQESIEQFLRSPEDIENKYAQETFEDIGQGKLLELAPELADKYHVVVVLGETSSGVLIGYKKRQISSWSDHNHYPFISNGGADIARMINESPRMDMDGGHIRTDTIDGIRISAGALTADRITTTHISDATIGSINADRIQATTFGAERYGLGVLNTSGVARINLDGLARRTTAPAQLAEIGIVGG